jgi:hypothetical protein
MNGPLSFMGICMVGVGVAFYNGVLFITFFCIFNVFILNVFTFNVFIFNVFILNVCIYYMHDVTLNAHP